MSYGESELDRLRRLNNYLSKQSTHWCPIVSSSVIKKTIVERCNKLGVSMMEICIRADVSWDTVKKYYLKEKEPQSRPSLRPEDVIKMGELIGIRIRTRTFRLPVEDIDVSKLLNDKFIPIGKRKKNKKLG